jgi:hypothetical protein
MCRASRWLLLRVVVKPVMVESQVRSSVGKHSSQWHTPVVSVKAAGTQVIQQIWEFLWARGPSCRAILSTAPPPSLRPLPALLHLLVQLLVHDLHGAVDLGIGRAKLMRNQFDQQVDALDERRAAGDRAGGR